MLKHRPYDRKIQRFAVFHFIVVILIAGVTMWTVRDIRLTATETIAGHTAVIVDTEHKTHQLYDGQNISKEISVNRSKTWSVAVFTLIILLLGVLFSFLILRYMADYMNRTSEKQETEIDQQVSDFKFALGEECSMRVKPQKTMDDLLYSQNLPKGENGRFPTVG